MMVRRFPHQDPLVGGPFSPPLLSAYHTIRVLSGVGVPGLTATVSNAGEIGILTVLAQKTRTLSTSISLRVFLIAS